MNDEVKNSMISQQEARRFETCGQCYPEPCDPYYHARGAVAPVQPDTPQAGTAPQAAQQEPVAFDDEYFRRVALRVAQTGVAHTLTTAEANALYLNLQRDRAAPSPAVQAPVEGQDARDAARLDWIERHAREQKIEIARSLYGTGYEFGFWPRCRAAVYTGSLRAAIDAAIARESEREKGR